MPRLQRTGGPYLRLRDLRGLRLGEVRMIAPASALPPGGSAAPPQSYAAWLELESPSGTGQRATRYLSLPPRGVLNPPASTGMVFWSINPYVGCEFGCTYCYARETHRWTVERAANRPGAPATAREAAALPAAKAFEQRILIKQGAAAVLARTLNAARVGTVPIVIGTATDPYQPAERRFRLTRELLELLRQHQGLHLGIITKSALIARDAALLAQLSERHQLSVHISLASLDAPLLRQLEPRTPIPAARLRAMRILADAGVPVGLLMAPILPGLTDSRDAMRALLLAAREAGASWAAGDPLRMGRATRHTLLPWLDRERPALARRYREHYQMRNGVDRDYATALKARLTALQEEVGLPHARRDRTFHERWSGAGQMELWGVAT
ncbi:MAG: radical SAM protein [Gemmatimonadota bacterium]